MSRIELHSPMPPGRCVAVLRDVIVNDWKWEGVAFGKPVAGTVRETSLKLRKRNFIYRNPLPTSLYAALAPEGSGTRISVHRGLGAATMVFTMIWLGVFLLIGLVVSIPLLDPHGPFPWDILIVPVIGVAMLIFSRLLAHAEHAFLLEFLARTLRAKEVVTPAPN